MHRNTLMLIREILWKVHVLFWVINVVGAEGRAGSVYALRDGCARVCVCVTVSMWCGI